MNTRIISKTVTLFTAILLSSISIPIAICAEEPEEHIATVPAQVVALKKDATTYKLLTSGLADNTIVQYGYDSSDTTLQTVDFGISSTKEIHIPSGKSLYLVSSLQEGLKHTFSAENYEVIVPGADGYWYNDSSEAYLAITSDSSIYTLCASINGDGFTAQNLVATSPVMGRIPVRQNGEAGIALLTEDYLGIGEFTDIECFDTDKPTVDITYSVTDGETVPLGETVTATVSATDSKSGILRLEYTNSSNQTNILDEPYKISFTKNAQGLVTAYDNAGNMTRSVVAVSCFQNDSSSSSDPNNSSSQGNNNSSSNGNNNSSSGGNNNNSSGNDTTTQYRIETKNSGSTVTVSGWDDYWEPMSVSQQKKSSSSSKSTKDTKETQTKVTPIPKSDTNKVAMLPEGYHYAYRETGPVTDPEQIKKELNTLVKEIQSSTKEQLSKDVIDSIAISKDVTLVKDTTDTPKMIIISAIIVAAVALNVGLIYLSRRLRK